MSSPPANRRPRRPRLAEQAIRRPLQVAWPTIRWPVRADAEGCCETSPRKSFHPSSASYAPVLRLAFVARVAQQALPKGKSPKLPKRRHPMPTLEDLNVTFGHRNAVDFSRE